MIALLFVPFWTADVAAISAEQGYWRAGYQLVQREEVAKLMWTEESFDSSAVASEDVQEAVKSYKSVR